MKVCILGTGAFGVALGLNVYENNHDVVMWTKFEDEANYLLKHRMSPTLPNVLLDEGINISTNLEESVKDSELIICVVPASAVRSTMEEVKKYITDKQHICIASKGIEQDTCKFVYDIVKEIIDTDKISVISGPTFAIDVANKVPVGLSLASINNDTIATTKLAIQNSHIKYQAITHFLVISISTQAMLVTELCNDIKYLIEDMGGYKGTIASFAGFGDILLTCTSPKSRNFTLGKLIGSKAKKKVITNYIETNTIEGLYTLKSIAKILEIKNLNLPIVNFLNNIIYNDYPVDDLITFIMEK